MGVLDRLWKAMSEAMFRDTGSDVADTGGAREHARASAIVLWLLGKTGAGKTAIVAALTGDPRA